MPCSQPIRFPDLAGIVAGVLALISPCVLAAEAPAPAGRFLYAGDDDWDWASPLGADKPCKLVRYGQMPWSALDWAEEGLPQVRGALVGTAPDPKKTMSMEQLSTLRGEKATYTHHGQAPGVIEQLLKAKGPPNLIILMQNHGRDGALDEGSIKTLIQFVNDGGRLVVLDDWKKYPAVLDAFVETALQVPPGPALQQAPVPKRPDPAAPPAENREPAPGPANQDDGAPEVAPGIDDLHRRFHELLPKLGADQFTVREEATAAIRELGPKVLALLKDVDTDDPEIASRLASIRGALTPKPRSKRPSPLSKKQQLAHRLAKLDAAAKLITDADLKLRQGKTSHEVSKVLVDGDKRLLPVLRLSFPPPR